MIKIQIILGSTREGRQGEKVARWIQRLALGKKDFATEFIDLKDWPFKFLSNPKPPSMHEYNEEIVIRWAEKVNEADGYIIVTPEYNHGYPAVLKNALDQIYREWNKKPVAFVGYGVSAGGARAVEQLVQVTSELQMVPLRDTILIPQITEAFDIVGNPKDKTLQNQAEKMFEKLIWFANILKEARLENKK